jgi:hypothetical protein
MEVDEVEAGVGVGEVASAAAQEEEVLNVLVFTGTKVQILTQEEEQLPQLPSAALPREAREFAAEEELQVLQAEGGGGAGARGEATNGSEFARGEATNGSEFARWLRGTDVMDLVGQFENSWQSVRPLLARLARAHAATEARLESADARQASTGGDAGARFTCFAITKVQILTPADARIVSTGGDAALDAAPMPLLVEQLKRVAAQVEEQRLHTLVA